MRLCELCNVQAGGTPARSKKEYWENGNIPWVKISDFKGKHLLITDEAITQRGFECSSAKVFPKGTLLYTIFATLGEVCILDIDATTNQAIAGIQIKNDSIEKEYLYYFLTSLKEQVNRIGRGVAQNNINMSILRNIEVPVPERTKQQKIAKVLDKLDSLIARRREQLAGLDALVKARFVEMFGDPVSNPLGLPKTTLLEIGEFGRGVSKHRPRNDPDLLGGRYPLIQTGDVAEADLYIKKYTRTYSELGLAQSKMWKKGTLCITIAANIAKTAILNFDACFPDSVVGFIANENANNIYVHYWFSFFQKILEAQAPESAQKNINLKILSELEIVCPSRKAQDEFADFVSCVDRTRETVQAGLAELETLKRSLMQTYFG